MRPAAAEAADRVGHRRLVLVDDEVAGPGRPLGRRRGRRRLRKALLRKTKRPSRVGQREAERQAVEQGVDVGVLVLAARRPECRRAGGRRRARRRRRRPGPGRSASGGAALPSAAKWNWPFGRSGEMVDELGALDRLALVAAWRAARRRGWRRGSGRRRRRGRSISPASPTRRPASPACSRFASWRQLGAVAAAEVPEQLLAGEPRFAAKHPAVDLEVLNDRAAVAPGCRAGFLQALAGRLVIGELGRRGAAAEPLPPGPVGADELALAVGQGERRVGSGAVERRAQEADVGALGRCRLEDRRRRLRSPREQKKACQSPPGRRGRRRRRADRRAPRTARRPRAGPRRRTATGRAPRDASRPPRPSAPAA